MHIKLALILSLVASVAKAATGDITGVSTTNNAGQAFYDSSANLTLYIAGMATNGTYNTGIPYSQLAASDTRDLSKAKIIVTLTSQGFDASGNHTTYQRTLYGTQQTRLPFPSNLTNNEVLFGSTLAISFWLSDYIYAGDSNITVTVASGVYVAAGVTNNAFSGSVTNASGLPYPNDCGQWTFPDRSRVVTTWTNRYFGAGKYAFNRRPLAYAYDVCTDAHGHSVTNTPTLVIDRTSKGHPVIDYASVCYATNFTQGDLVTNNFFLEPWIGTNVVSSASLTNCAPQFELCDRSNLFDAVAVLAPSSSGPGIATNSANLSVALANPYTNINAAFTGLKAVTGRGNASGGIVYCEAGSYPSQIPQTGSHSGDDCWTTVMPAPGVAQASVIFTNIGTLEASPYVDFLKFQNVTLLQNNQYLFFYFIPSGLWLDNCFFSGYLNGMGAGGAGIFLSVPTNYMTGCVVSNNYYNGSWYGQILRGGLFDNMYRMGGASGTPEGLILSINGNIFNSNTNDQSDFWDSGPQNAVFLNNSIFGAGRLSLAPDDGTYGTVIIQSEFEKLIGSAQPIIGIAASGSGPGTTNVLMAKCTTIGDRCNLFYYQAATSPSWIREAILRDNLLSGLATKNDVFLGATDPTDAPFQYGGWAFANGVGCGGNYYRQWTGTAGVGNNFPMEFCGLNSIAAYAPTSPNSFPVQYVLDASAYGTDLGKGNYRLQSFSPVLRMKPTWNGLPWDIEGVWRGDWDPPGAYSSANPQRGAMLQ